jgi:DNA polymerase I-like protein with 3'-5' exonuclease and polymerase domains
VNGLNRADPEIPKWWNEIRNRYRREGFIADAIWGRRRDFRDEEKINELVNHPIQAGGASVIHEAMLELVDGNPGWGTSSLLGDSSEIVEFDFEKKTGLVNQCHDSLLFEVPECEGERVAEILEAAMTRRRRVEPLLTYTAEAEVGMNWLEV